MDSCQGLRRYSRGGELGRVPGDSRSFAGLRGPGRGRI